MKNRLLEKIQESKRRRTKLFSAFLTLGFPSLGATAALIDAFAKEGVDILELGFPFSDPLADGPTIQYSSEQALRKGVHIEDAFRLVKELRRRGNQIPIVFFTYMNPVLHYGVKLFVARAKEAGFDGLLVPDLPPEEESDLNRECKKRGLAQIYLIAPTTEKKRATLIARKSQGFIYYVSLRGVTGARKFLPGDVRRHLRELREVTDKPVLVGFGVSSPEQARMLSRMSEGVIVGSALIERIRRSGGRVEEAIKFVRQMIHAVKSGSR